MGTPVPVLYQSAEGYVQPVATTDEVSIGKLDINGVGGGDLVGIALAANMRITGVPTNPTADTDAVNKAYVDSVAQGLSVKAAVEAVSTTPLTSPPTGLPLIDGEFLDDGDRVLLTGQASAIENGIWLAHGAKASLNIGTVTSTNFNTIIRAMLGGTSGNSVKLATVADGTGAGNFTFSGTFPNVVLTFHYQTAVTLVSDFEAAVAALAATAHNWIEVLTPSTHQSYTLTDTADTFNSTAGTLTGGSAAAWTRPADFAALSHAQGVFVLDIGPDEGSPQPSVWKGSGWVCTTVAPNDVVGTNNLTFVQFSAAQNLTASHGVIISANDIQAVPGNGIRLTPSTLDHIEVNLSSSSPGLALVGTAPNKTLEALPDTARGLAKDGSGIYIELEPGTTPYPSLHFDSGNGGALDVKVKANAGLVTDTSGLGVKVDSVYNNIGISSGATGGLYATGAPSCVGSYTDAGGIAAFSCVYAAGNSVVSQGSNGGDATARIIGVALASISNGNAGLIVSEGVAGGVLAGGGQFGVPYYLGPTGLLVLAAGVTGGGAKRYIEVGIALNANDLWVDIKDYGKKA